MIRSLILIACILTLYGCGSPQKDIPVIGFLDFVQDETLEAAKDGFFEALEDNGYSEKKNNIKVLYRNAQGDQPALLQSCDYLISQDVAMIAANTTLATITAVQRTRDIPVCMMVAPRPDLAGLTDEKGNAPANLFGVYETLEYIDTSMMLIRQVLPSARKVGALYSQSEPQSVDALNRIKAMAGKLGFDLVSLPVNSSAETQIVTEAILGKGIDVFFALPDNVIFSSFETVAKICNEKNVPVFTSEAGLVKRGALAAFGADMNKWGYQAGLQAVKFLNDRSGKSKPEIVSARRKVFNRKVAERFHLSMDSSFTPL